MPAPNILLITADHMRADCVGANGNDFIETPNLDRLAREGVNFTNAFTPNPICVPARATITTGNYSHRATGSKNNGGLIRDDQPRIAQHFRDAGYATSALGKLHYVPYAPPGEPRLLHGFEYAELCESGRILRRYDPEGKRRGLEDYHDYLYDVGWGGYERAHGVGNNDIHPAPSPLPKEHYVDAWVADRSIARLREHVETRGDQPFFMWTSFPKPHSPYDPPEPYHRLYDPRDLPAAHGDVSMLAGRNPQITRIRLTHGIDRFSPEMIRLARAFFYGCVTFQDEMVGRLLDCLEEIGLRDNTIVIYTADHGDLLGDFGGFYKANMLNGSVRVPAIWSAPGVFRSGVSSSDLVGGQDILPTVAALTGVGLEEEVHGLDLSDMLASGAPVGRDFYVSQCLDPPWQSYMICDGKTKYCYSEANGTEEFYDLENDPNELQNLAAQVDLQPWRRRVVQWCRDHGDSGALDGDGLKRTEMPIEEIEAEFRPNSMGWRWY